MKRILQAIVAAAGAAALCATAQAPHKIVPAESFIRFVTQQMNVPVEGKFRSFDATVAFDPAKPAATKAEFEVDLASIDLGNAEGETEVKGKPWLNVQVFPKAKFAAASVKPLAGGKYEASGPLTIKGITQTIVATFTLTESGGMRTVEGTFPMKRLAFKIGEGAWSDTDTVADQVLIRFRFVLPSR